MKKIFSHVAVLLATVFLASSCDDNAIPERTSYVTSGAQLKLYNHVEGSPMVNFYLGNERVTTASPTTAGALRGLGFGATYPSVYGYTVVPAGATNIIARDTSVNEPASFDAACKVLSWKKIASPYKKLAEKAITLDNNTNYSAFLVGLPAIMGKTSDSCAIERKPASYEILVSRDNLPEPNFSKVYFRFMNTLAGAPYNFDVVATRMARVATATLPAQDEVKTVIATNIAFKEFGSYVEVPFGNYRVDFYKAGTYETATPVKYLSYPTSSATATITTLALGRVYTFFLRGTYSVPFKTTHVDYWRER